MLPRMICIYNLPLSLLVTTLGISSVPFLFCFGDSFKSCNNDDDDVEHKLYFGFSAAMMV